MLLLFTLASPPCLIASITSSTGARRTLFQLTLPLPTPLSNTPNLLTKPWNAALEFLFVVLALRRVLIRASRMEGTSPHPDTSRDGAGIFLGAFSTPRDPES